MTQAYRSSTRLCHGVSRWGRKFRTPVSRGCPRPSARTVDRTSPDHAHEGLGVLAVPVEQPDQPDLRGAEIGDRPLDDVVALAHNWATQFDSRRRPHIEPTEAARRWPPGHSGVQQSNTDQQMSFRSPWSSSTSSHHRDLTTHPGAGMLDRPTRSMVCWLNCLEQGKDVLRAHCCPQSEKVAILIGESPTAADRHESRVRDLRQNHGWRSLLEFAPHPRASGESLLSRRAGAPECGDCSRLLPGQSRTAHGLGSVGGSGRQSTST